MATLSTTAERNAKFEDKWWSAPHSSNIGGWFVRKDVAEKAGGSVDLTKFNTMQERLDAAVKMSGPEMYGFGALPSINLVTATASFKPPFRPSVAARSMRAARRSLSTAKKPLKV